MSADDLDRSRGRNGAAEAGSAGPACECGPMEAAGGVRAPAPRPDADLLLRETIHRCNNDLQLVVSLLQFQCRRVSHPETRAELGDAVERVAILARARSAMQGGAGQSLEAALRKVCEALRSQAEPRGIAVLFEAEPDAPALSRSTTMTVSLAVNELATNAIKHGFRAGRSGTVRVVLRRPDDGFVGVLVDDDGLPFLDSPGSEGSGSGLGLVKRLIASAGGSLGVPTDGSKRFSIRVPAGSA